MMPPRNWLAAVLLLRMRPQSKEPRKRVTRTSPVTAFDAGFAEHRAVGMHRPVGGFERLGCCGFGDDAVTTGALQDGRVGFVPARIAEMGEAAVEAADLLGFEAGERRVVAGELEEVGHQHTLGRGHRGADRGGLLRAAGEDDARHDGVGVEEGHALHGQAEAFGRDLGVGGGGAHAHFVGGDLDGGESLRGSG